MLLRAEAWWLWHAIACIAAYQIGFWPVLDWLLLVVYLCGNFVFLHWVQAYYSQKNHPQKKQRLWLMILSQLPIICVWIPALCILTGVFYSDIPLVILQLSSAIWYPLIVLAPDTALLDMRMYLWSACMLLMLQSCVLPLCMWLCFPVPPAGK